METHEFTVIASDIDDATIDAVAGKCPDSGVGTRSGTTFVDFDRNAQSLGQAIDSALADLERVDVHPIRVLVDVAQPA